jgi:hypothetical protein
MAADAAGDSDFCSVEHRKRFQSRLKKALTLLGPESGGTPRLAPAIITYIPANQFAQPAQPEELRYPLRFSMACFAIDADLPPNLGAAIPAEVINEPTDKEVLRSARFSPSEDGRRNEVRKPDRIAVLGSRLRALRTELDRASGGPGRLATA